MFAATERVTEAAIDDPTELTAVTEYVVGERTPVGVPEITHVEVLRLNSGERAGEIVQFVIAAPFGESVVGLTNIAVPTMALVPSAPEKFNVGTPGTAESVTVAEDDPIALVEVTVYSVASKVFVIIPEITQVELFILRPGGN